MIPRNSLCNHAATPHQSMNRVFSKDLLYRVKLRTHCIFHSTSNAFRSLDSLVVRYVTRQIHISVSCFPSLNICILTKPHPTEEMMIPLLTFTAAPWLCGTWCRGRSCAWTSPAPSTSSTSSPAGSTMATLRPLSHGELLV